jgi:hypothetical protein
MNLSLLAFPIMLLLELAMLQCICEIDYSAREK